MLFIFLELSNISVAVFVVVNAFGRFSTMKLPCEELSVGEQVGAFTMKEVITPLAKIDVSVGVPIYSIAMLLLLVGLSNVSRVVHVFERHNALTETVATIREVSIDEFLDEILAIRS